MRIEYRKLDAQQTELVGEDSLIVQREKLAIVVAALDDVRELAGLMVKLEEEGSASDDLRAYLDEIMQQVPRAITLTREDLAAQIEAAQTRRDEAAAEDIALVEEEIAAIEQQVNDLFDQSVDYIEAAEALGTDVEESGPNSSATWRIAQICLPAA